ncbi:MAG: ATP-binding protein, partial [Rubrimonas sp.]
LWCADCDVAALARVLPHLAALATLKGERADLAARVARMREALDAFGAMIAPARAILGLEAGSSPADVVRAMEARADAAAAIRNAMDADAAAIAEADRDIEAAGKAATAARIEIGTILGGQAIDPALPPLEALAALQTRDALREKKARLEHDRRSAGAGLHPDALSAEEADPDPARTAALKDAVEDAEAEASRLSEALGAARGALQAAEGRDGVARALQARATLIETLREEARAQAARLLGLRAARDALRRLREANRGPMLEDAEAAFRRLTCGEWDRLQPEPDRKGESVLKALRGGRAHAVNELSTGTRAQLYLALRIAGYRRFLSENGPLPFVTDDIHETFDEGRVEAALDLAAELGEKGQMIVFTHHAHVVGIARARLPSARTLEILRPGAAV